MQIKVRGDNVKLDAEARALIIKGLNAAAEGWLHCAADSPVGERFETLADVGNVKAFATLLEPKPDSDE